MLVIRTCDSYITQHSSSIHLNILNFHFPYNGAIRYSYAFMTYTHTSKTYLFFILVNLKSHY